MSLKHFVDHCVKHHFLSYNLDRLSFLGLSMQKKIEQEWCFHNISLNGPVFPIQHSGSSPLSVEIVQNYIDARSLLNVESTISIAYKHAPIISPKIKANQPTEDLKTLADLIEAMPETYMNLSMFSLPAHKLEDFTRVQKKRHLWWKSLLQQTELKTKTASEDLINTHPLLEQKIIFSSNILNGEPMEVLSIWKPQIFEDCQLSDELKKSVMSKYQRKATWPCLVTCQVRLEVATLFFLMDAFIKHNKNATLSLHKYLAPYSVAVKIDNLGSDQPLGELQNLQRLLCLKLSHQRRISVLPFNSQWSITQCDARAVPYTILLTSETLKQGVCNLRTRDTTLKEQVHVSEIVERMEHLLS